MKIDNNILEVTRSGSFQERGFNIANNAKAFDILSSKIYTDVPLAIVRELSTNASDSHVDAKNADQPFRVHLPNMLEPWLTISDSGTGLSPEHVETIYTTYFKSTRSNSDDFTGCLGLGSKSPFAYTDQFSIVSNWNGRKFTYSAFKNEEGCPSLALLGEVETTDPNGLEIRIPIKPGDSGQFVEAAQRVYRFFKVRPTITGAELEFDELNVAAEGTNYKLCNVGYNGGNIRVIMGQVCYNVDSYRVSASNVVGSHADLLLYMPIGSCAISASREELHYDDKTCEAVRLAAIAAMDDAGVKLEATVQNSTCVWDRIRSLAQFRNLHPNIKGKSGINSIPSAEKDKYSMKQCSLNRGGKLFIQTHNVNDFDYYTSDRKTAFVEENADLTQNLKNRIRAYMNNNKVVVLLVKIQDAARFAELFGATTSTLTGLPDVPRAPRDPNARTQSSSKPIKLMSDTHHYNMAFEWENVHSAADVKTKDACCVVREGTWVMWQGNKVKPERIRILAHALGFKRVYGISDKRYANMVAKLGLEELSVVAKDRATALVNGLNLYALAKIQHGDTTSLSTRIPLKLIKGLSTECDDFVKMMDASIDNMSTYKDLCAQFSIEMPKAPNYAKAFYEKYPILVAIDWYRGTMTTKHATDYINMVEAST